MAPVQGGSRMVPGMLEVGRHSLGADRLEAGIDGPGLEDCACRVSCGLEDTGRRHRASPGSALTTGFSAFSRADKKSYKETESGPLVRALFLRQHLTQLTLALPTLLCSWG